jgi:hypothetical protein
MNVLVPLHAADFSPVARGVVGLVVGLVATVMMNVPMHRLPEGSTPPFVAAGALTGTAPADVTPPLASGVHYISGALGGVFYTVVTLAVESVRPFRLLTPVGEAELVPHLLAVLATFAFLVVFFAYLVLPTFGGAVRDRASLVRRDWVISAGTYALALLVVVPVALAVV